MNGNSLLCRYLESHEDWESRLREEYGISTGREGPYAIFNYGHDADYSNPLVQEARGIILDTEKLDVVCWPFRKFGNYQESYADQIDWSTAHVQEKIDGSIIKLWYSERDKKWVFSTNGVIYAEKAPVYQSQNALTFYDVILSADNYGRLEWKNLHKDRTYIFELVGPATQVVIRYDEARLFHTGTRNNLTGEESDEQIGIPHPVQYSLHSLGDCVEAARHLNDGNGDAVEKEGFVVVDAQWHRVKIKSPDYLVKHKLSQVYLSKDNCLELFLKQNIDVRELCRLRPVDARVLKYYDWQLEEVFSAADQIAVLARSMYEEYEHDRGAVARGLAGNPLSFIGFSALESNLSGRELLEKAGISRIGRLIPAYKGSGLSAVSSASSSVPKG